MANKPIVLHLGDAIKYNNAFSNEEFAARFKVIQATETNREEFVQALKSKKYPWPNLWAANLSLT